MRPDLEGRPILVTGASGGIGRAIAAQLFEAGAHCLLHYRRHRQPLEELAAGLRSSHPFAPAPIIVQADLQQEDEVDQLLDSLPEGRSPYGLVVNAGIWPETAVRLTEMTLDQWQRTLAINLTGAFLTCRAFLRRLETSAASSAAIVLVGSTAGLFGEEGHADYAASKAALQGLMLSLKNEIIRTVPRGRVNLIHPGWVETPMAADALEDPATVQRVTATMALRKVAQPEDVAALTTFLLSERLSGHLTGTNLPVAGGMEGRLLHP